LSSHSAEGKNIMSIVEQLAEVPLFKGVDAEHREALIGLMQRQTFVSGETVFRRGDPGDSMYVILKGAVRIYTEDAQGNEFTIRNLDKMFGEWTMLDGEPRSASAEAVGDLEVLTLHRNDFKAFVRERPLVGLAMMRDLAERVRYTTTYLKRVIDATEEISQGDYAPHLQTVQAESGSGEDEAIEQLVGQFIDMVNQVQERERHLKEGADRAS
jgi:CRP-like cAMP-binding protein